MSFTAFEASALLAILPEIGLFLLAALLLAADLIGRPGRRNWIGWMAAAGVGLILVAAGIFARPEGEPGHILGGMIRHDWTAFAFQGLILFAAGISSLLSIQIPGVGDRGEYYALMMVSAMGMSFMAAASDLIMLYLAIETTSIPLYILAGFLKGDDRSAESGLKYFLFGALTSTVMLYGFSLLYGFAGETNLYALAGALRSAHVSPIVMGSVALLILVGFGFKVAAVPFHFWTPDVYEGAPTPITAYVSTASKAAGFAVLFRVMTLAFPAIQGFWAPMLGAMAAATMTLGNVLAIAQTNIKRLLAYSSIAHAGYALIGLVALSGLGSGSMLFYLLAYIVTNLAAFAVVILFAQSVGSDQIADYAGLSRRSPWLALALMIAFLSLAGMPPFVGFVAKVYVFAAAVDSGLVWLAFVGVLNAIVGLYYYLTVLKVVYLYRSQDDHKPITMAKPHAIALAACIGAILVVGILSGPWLDWGVLAAQSLF